MAVVEADSLHRECHLEMEIGLTPHLQQAGGSRHDDLCLRTAIFHLGQNQPVGVGVKTHSAEFSHDDLLRVPGQFGPRQADVLDRLHLQPGQRQPLSQFGDGYGDVHVVF